MFGNNNDLRNIYFIIFLSFVFSLKNSHTLAQGDKIIGVWVSEKNDLKIEIFNKNGKYFGKMLWFVCEVKGKEMLDYQDTKNPNPALRNRNWLGMQVVEDLRYDKKTNLWKGGSLYDPNEGKTYKIEVSIDHTQTLFVRAYWGVYLLGKTLVFCREN